MQLLAALQTSSLSFFSPNSCWGVVVAAVAAVLSSTFMPPSIKPADTKDELMTLTTRFRLNVELDSVPFRLIIRKHTSNATDMLHLLLAALAELERAIDLPLDIRSSEMNVQYWSTGYWRLIRSCWVVVFLRRFHLLDTSIIWTRQHWSWRYSLQFAVNLLKVCLGYKSPFFGTFYFLHHQSSHHSHGQDPGSCSISPPTHQQLPAVLS